MRIEIRTNIDLPEEDRELIDYIIQKKQTHQLGLLIGKALHEYAYGVEDEQGATQSVQKVATEETPKAPSTEEAQADREQILLLRQENAKQTELITSLLEDIKSLMTKQHTNEMIELGVCKSLIGTHSLIVEQPSMIRQPLVDDTRKFSVPNISTTQTPTEHQEENKIEKPIEQEEKPVEQPKETRVQPKETKVQPKEQPKTTQIETTTDASSNSEEKEEELSEEDAKALAALFFKN